MPDDDVVLLTGYPGMLARAVAREVLEDDPRARIHALVRSRFLDEARRAVESLEESSRSRVVLVEGDSAAIDMGLSGLEYRALAGEVTRLHHCAQVTDHGADRTLAEHGNIGGAREAVEFASACTHLKCMVYHSTAHVAGDRTGVVREDELEAGQSFRTVVEETRARAEKIVRSAMPRVPVAIVRPATVVGDSRTGEVDRLDGPYLLVLLVVTTPSDIALPLPGFGEAAFNVVPVDWVARAAVAIGRDAGAVGGTFHLVDRRPVSARRAFEVIAKAAGRRGPLASIPANLAKALLRTPGLDRIAKSPRAFLDTVTTAVTYDATQANERLAMLGVGECPPFESYAAKMVHEVEQKVRSRRASRRGTDEVEDPLA
jgi:thioester reductase-like protein